MYIYYIYVTGHIVSQFKGDMALKGLEGLLGLAICINKCTK